MTSYNSEVETDIETDSLLSEEETDDYSLNEENDFYDPEEQSLTKYNIVLCERYNQNIHGIWDDGICNNDINKYYLTQYRLKKYNKYLINDIKRLNPRFKTEIAECIVLPSQYNISILKTFWLRLVQRVWKKIFMERKNIIKKRSNPTAIFHREIYGRWPNDCVKYPNFKGMLYNLSRTSPTIS